MNKLIIDSLIIGLITSVLGSVILRVIITGFNKVEKNESLEYMLKKYKKNYIIEIALFFTGISIHLLLEYFGINKWYCEKKCAVDKCKIICERDLGPNVISPSSKISKDLKIVQNELKNIKPSEIKDNIINTIKK